jgi:tetratricopeptide (TPR) repeat protein
MLTPCKRYPVLALFALCAIAPDTKAEDAGLAQFNAAWELWNNGEAEQARLKLSSAGRMYPQALDLKFFLAVWDRAESSRKEAENFFRLLQSLKTGEPQIEASALALKLDDLLVRQAAGELSEVEKKEKEDALDQLGKLADANPENFALNWIYASELLAFKKTKLAENRFFLLLPKVKLGVRSFHEEAVDALFQQKKYQEATAYLAALSQKANQPWALCLTGKVMALMKQEDQCNQAYDAATKLDEKRAETWLEWGVVLEALLHKSDEAVTKLDQAIELDRNNAESYRNRGIIKFRQKKYDEAIADLKNALHANSSDLDLRGQLAYCYFQTKQYEESYKEYHTVVSRKKEPMPTVRFNLAALAAATGKKQKCISELRAWIKEANNDNKILKPNLLKIPQFKEMREDKQFIKIVAEINALSGVKEPEKK